MRTLIRNATFRKAMSLAYDRANAQKVIYFNTGELTTGTLSPKALEYHVGSGSSVYASWRDSALKYDPAQAKQMLDSIGVKMNGQWRTMPDGSPLTITLDYPADQDPNGEHVKKDELLAKDWQAIGINAKLNPVTPASFGEKWAAGQILTTTAWEVGDGPNHLVYPQWLVPLENSRWAPLEGTYQTLIGTPAANTGLNESDPYKSTPPRVNADKGGPVDKLWTIYNQSKIEPDQTKRNQMVWDMIKIHVSDGPFFSGTVANYPRIVLVKEGLKNVPSNNDLGPQNGYQHGFVNPWVIPSPAVYDPETYYWTDPTQHTS
jgi:peptide/nickel transport system substrate-binding protein